MEKNKMKKDFFKKITFLTALFLALTSAPSGWAGPLDQQSSGATPVIKTKSAVAQASAVQAAPFTQKAVNKYFSRWQQGWDATFKVIENSLKGLKPAATKVIALVQQYKKLSAQKVNAHATQANDKLKKIHQAHLLAIQKKTEWTAKQRKIATIEENRGYDEAKQQTAHLKTQLSRTLSEFIESAIAAEALDATLGALEQQGLGYLLYDWVHSHVDPPEPFKTFPSSFWFSIDDRVGAVGGPDDEAQDLYWVQSQALDFLLFDSTTTVAEVEKRLQDQATERQRYTKKLARDIKRFNQTVENALKPVWKRLPAIVDEVYRSDDLEIAEFRDWQSGIFSDYEQNFDDLEV